tara:strand:- start:16119 stop:16595 length:477 start_codon:yes stop_codon:yes gene_type:complete
MSYRNIKINEVNDVVAATPEALPQIITALKERLQANEAKGGLKAKAKNATLRRALAELNANGVLAVDPKGRLDGSGLPKMACWFNPAKLAEEMAATAAPTPPKVEVAEAAFATEASSQAKLLQAQLELRKLDLAGKTSKKAKAELEKLADIEALISSI